MIKNYLKIALRNLLKYKGFSFINILGLAIGIACCILILLFVQDELSYDRFHEKSDQIYRIGLNGRIGNTEFHGAISPAPMAEALVRDFPEVVSAARIKNFGFPVLRYGDKVFSEEKFFWVDSTFFDVFTIQFVKGNPKTALTQPGTILLTERMAKKYFGEEDPVGKSINSDNRRDYIIAGVVKEFPSNSHFHFDFLAALSTYDDSRNPEWLNNSYHTYILLQKDFPVKEFEKKLPGIVRKYVGPRIEEVVGASLDQLFAEGSLYEYLLQPLTDIHLHSNLEHELEPNGDILYVYIFSLIAAGILFIACINFMNLTTARSSNRAKEIGIRKTLGSNRPQLIRQFLVETILMSSISVMFALLFVELVLPPFNNLISKNLDVSYLENFYTIPALLFLTIMIGAAAGSYPAFLLSSFNPVKVLKKGVVKKGKTSWLRNGLVIFQFSISIILFIGTFVVYGQLEFIQNKKLGFNKEQVLVIQKTDDLGARIFSFKEELLRIPGVISVNNSTTLPGKEFDSNSFHLSDRPATETNIIWSMRSDEDFTQTYQVRMAAGRFYSKDRSADSASIVVNEAAVKAMGIMDPVGKEISPLDGNRNNRARFRIIGVMKDFHFESLHQQIKPLTVRLFNRNGYGRYIAIRLAPGNPVNTIKLIETKWKEFANAQTFEYFFFDDEFAKVYKAEKRTGVLVTTFSILAIFIACMGLLGLAAFTTEQRTKEIGIRKTLGATVTGIIFLLTKDFTKWVLIANIIAWPLAYLLMIKWLENFAYKIDIGISAFLIAGIAAFIIALITVSSQAVKVALANPVNSLKYE